MLCRHCSEPLNLQVIDLGAAPPSNAFNDSQEQWEKHWPLRVLFCTACGLAQTDISLFQLRYDELFTVDYPYYSSTSKTFLEHSKAYAEGMTQRLNLDKNTLTVEVGCNDGYLLQYFNSPKYGIEPTQTGNKAREKGIKVYANFFGRNLANYLVDHGQADLMICNNVLAHVPDINDFVAGFATLLKRKGIATFEFPSLMNLVDKCQFDTIYHEHYSYLSLTAVANIFKRNGLEVFDVQHIPTHGGSLRVFAQTEWGCREPTTAVAETLLAEWPLAYPQRYFADFQAKANKIKDDLIGFLLWAKSEKKKVGSFGAAAKANTLLNYAGIRSDLIPYCVDETQAK